MIPFEDIVVTSDHSSEEMVFDDASPYLRRFDTPEPVKFPSKIKAQPSNRMLESMNSGILVKVLSHRNKLLNNGLSPKSGAVSKSAISISSVKS
jgi:hypothetical protein